MNKIAVHAFDTLWNRLLREHAECAYHDAGFDGGEFSGPFHDRAVEEASTDLLQAVAHRFAMEPDRLYNEHRQWCEETAHRAWNSYRTVDVGPNGPICERCGGAVLLCKCPDLN